MISSFDKIFLLICLNLIVFNAYSQQEKIHKERGNEYYYAAKYELAIQEYRKSISVNKLYAPSYHNIGLCYENLNQADSSIYYYSKAIKLDSLNAGYYMSRAEIFETQDDVNKLIEDSRTVISLTKDSLMLARSYQLIGHRRMDQEDYTTSFFLFDSALSFNPKGTYLKYFRGATALEIKKYEIAYDDFRSVIESDPDMEPAYVFLGRTLIRLRRPEEAIEILNRAIDLEPTDAFAYYYRGYAKWYLNREVEADSDMKKANELGLDAKFWPKPD